MKNLFIIALLLAAGVLSAQAADTQPQPAAPAETPSAAAQAPQSTAADAAAPAQTPAQAPAPAAPSFLQQELAAAASELSSGQVGTMNVSDLEKLAAHLSIAIQKSRYVERARSASFALPGLGQFMTGDTLGGWLFVAWDVTIFAGTLLSAYFVLPANVQFGSLDYFSAPISTIRSAWESNNLVSYLPLAGVLVGGMILETVLRYVSAENAAQSARKNINAGKVTFEPTLDFLDGGPGFGMRMRY